MLPTARHPVAIAFCALVTLSAAPVAAQFQVLAEGGDPVPGGGELFTTQVPVLQALDTVFFTARISTPGIDPHGLFRAEAGEPLEIVVREGDPAPDGNGNFPRPEEIFANEAGEVAFAPFFDNSLGGFDDSGAIVVADGATGDLSVVVRGKDAVPDNPGDEFFPTFGPVMAFNDAGEVAFAALEVVDEVFSLWRGSAAPGSLTRIVTQGDSDPGGTGFQSDAFVVNSGGIALNDAGQAAFVGLVVVPDDDDFVAIYRGSGGALAKVVRAGDPAPGGNGAFNTFAGLNFARLRINGRGDVAFIANLLGTSGGTTDNTGLFLGRPGSVRELARRGDPVPDGNGSFLIDGFGHVNQIALNDRGQVAFGSRVSGAAGGATEGLFLAEENGIEQIARLNQTVPGGGTLVEFLETVALNNNGQVLFWALVDVGAFSAINVPFLYEQGELTSIVREGDSISGLGTVLDLTTPGLDQGEPERSLLNDVGQVALKLDTDQSDGAIVLWTPDSLVFADGFESGDTTDWSSTQ